MRKYNEFKIEVEFLNGDIEEINYKSYDTKSYKQMMELYKETRETYSDTSCKIKFKGISEEGELGVLFIKEIKTKDQELKEEAEYIEETEIKELLNNIRKDFRRLENKKNSLKGKLYVVNKELEVIYHNFESGKYNTATEKVRAGDDITRLRRLRRQLKKGVDFFHTFEVGKSYSFVNINEVIDAIEWIDKMDKKNTKRQEENTYEKKYSIEEFKYKNHIERLSILKDIQNKYDNIINDEKNMKLLACNNSNRKK